jgi:foldase protein PrsA
MENKVTQEESTEHEKKSEKKSRKLKLKMIIIFVIIIILGVLAYMGKGLFVAATVNGSPITRLSLIKMLEKEAGKGLLDSLITEKLIQNEAIAKNIIISEDDVNSEIDKIKAQVTSQGDTFEAALEAQGMTLDVLKKQIKLQKEIEALLADKVSVTDQEVTQYITDNKYPVTEGQEQIANEQVMLQLKSKKLSAEAPTYIEELKAKAKIKYFVNY